MTEQIEDDFWAAERARDTAARGGLADPGACGTCKASVAAGGQVKHDECAQRATLLPAPDAPHDELILGMTEDEVHALPARFHVPAFIEPTRSWVCAVCWGDGWSTQWPCKTATEQGLRVFTAEDYAETAVRRQRVEMEKLRAERDEFCNRVDTLTAVAKGNKRHVADMFMDLQAAQQERDEARNRVAELEAELKKYVGAEPTIADEMAHLNRCIDAVDALQLPDTLKVDSISGDYRNGYIHALADMRTALEAPQRTSYPPALPWAALMDDEDLAGFLAELEDATATPGATPSEALAAVEEACGTWRLMAETQHAHNTAPGPSAEAARE